LETFINEQYIRIEDAKGYDIKLTKTEAEELLTILIQWLGE